ncbi:ATP synthase F0 subunit B [Candidatus Parcubacteria bacterium]|nr:MAG: ATP synthase F0 subunit B [Candidatus Parcubacteria bacterium]
MMEILDTFGFNINLFIAQIINFLILAYLFKRFLYGPIINIMKQREDRIKQGLEDAEKTKEELEKARGERDKILKETRVEADKIIENTRAMTEEAREKIIGSAKGEANKLIKQAKEQGEIEIKNMQREAQKLTIDISQKILNKVIKEIFTKEEQKKILERSLKDLSKYEQS